MASASGYGNCIKQLEEIQSIFAAWTQRDADILTTPELYKKYARPVCAE